MSESNEWISVKDRLPEVKHGCSDEVLIAIGDPHDGLTTPAEVKDIAIGYLCFDLLGYSHDIKGNPTAHGYWTWVKENSPQNIKISDESNKVLLWMPLPETPEFLPKRDRDEYIPEVLSFDEDE